jgi:hypothetical protein
MVVRSCRRIFWMLAVRLDLEGRVLNSCYSMIFRIALGLAIATGTAAHADRVGYNRVVNISAETETLRAEHHHDWSDLPRAPRKKFSTTENPCAADIDDSSLRLCDKTTGLELFRRPVPALTHIWISPGSEYVVGISNVMLRNPYQLVVFNRAGDRLLERNMVGVNWPGVSQSVTNWIYWYKEPVPQMKIVKEGATATLSIEDPLGVLREFQFPAGR